jgi:hypothetical protein
MTADERWRRYLFDGHSPGEIGQWARALRYFRFCRAHDGLNGDADALQVAYRFESNSHLASLLSVIGARPGSALYPTWSDPAGPKTVLALPGEPPRVITLPGLIAIGDGCASAVITDGRLLLRVSDAHNPEVVTHAAVESAIAIEKWLAPIAFRRVDPPLNDRHCVCPAFYPELWPVRYRHTWPSRRWRGALGFLARTSALVDAYGDFELSRHLAFVRLSVDRRQASAIVSVELDRAPHGGTLWRSARAECFRLAVCCPDGRLMVVSETDGRNLEQQGRRLAESLSCPFARTGTW